MRNSREIEREEIWLYLLRNVSKFLSPSLVLYFVVFIFIINFLEFKKKITASVGVLFVLFMSFDSEVG